MSINEKLAKAVNLSENGDVKGAKKILEEIVVMNSSSPKIHAALGSTYWDLQDIDSAISEFKEAVDLAPSWEDASLGLFHCLWESDKKDDAMVELKRFMAIGTSTDYEEIIKEINQKMR